MAAENNVAARGADCCPLLCDRARSIQRRPSANWLCQYQNGPSAATKRKPSSVRSIARRVTRATMTTRRGGCPGHPEAIEPRRLVLSSRPPAPASQGQESGRAPDGRDPLRRYCELLDGELADGLQHPKARSPWTTSVWRTRLLSTSAVNAVKKSNSSPGCIRVSAAARSSRRRIPQSTKQHLFAGREQVVAPGNGIAQRLLPRGQIAGTTGQHGKRRSSRSSSAGGGSTLMRAAASSIASGNPSRRAQMPATAAALSPSAQSPA